MEDLWFILELVGWFVAGILAVTVCQYLYSHFRSRGRRGRRVQRKVPRNELYKTRGL